MCAYASNYIARKPFSRPFLLLRTYNLTSDNPRTIQNHSYWLAKRGLELAEYRDDWAFRTQKSRALKRLCTSDGGVNMSPVEQEEAEEEIEVTYEGNDLEVGFNVNYLLDALAAIDGQEVELGLTDSNSSCLIRSPGNASAPPRSSRCSCRIRRSPNRRRSASPTRSKARRSGAS